MTDQEIQASPSPIGSTSLRPASGMPLLQMILTGAEHEAETDADKVGADRRAGPSITSETAKEQSAKERAVRRIIEHLSKEP